MHLKYSSCRGMSVLEEGSAEEVGSFQEFLIHPDTGKIEGCFVAVPEFFWSQILFVPVTEIVRWGTRISIRSSKSLFPIEENVRLLPLFLGGRAVLRQPIRTETGKYIGRCMDIQFDTRHFMVEWIFPRRMLRWGTALPLSSIVEVRKDSIIVRDASVREPMMESAPEIPAILKPMPAEA